MLSDPENVTFGTDQFSANEYVSPTDTPPKRKGGRPKGAKRQPDGTFRVPDGYVDDGKSSRTSAVAGKDKREKVLIERVTGLYSTIGFFVGAFNAQDGTTIVLQANDRATELVNVARHHQRMWNTLEAITQGGDYVPLIIGHTSLALAIMANHGVTLETLLKRAKSEESPNGHVEPDSQAYNDNYAGFPQPQ